MFIHHWRCIIKKGSTSQHWRCTKISLPDDDDDDDDDEEEEEDDDDDDDDEEEEEEEEEDYYCHQKIYRARELFLGIISVILHRQITKNIRLELIWLFWHRGGPFCRDLFWMKQHKN